MVKPLSTEIDAERAAEIVLVMQTMGVDEIEAGFIVALERGETYGDVQSVGPMTPEERRRIGLDILAFDEPDGEEDDEIP